MTCGPSTLRAVSTCPYAWAWATQLSSLLGSSLSKGTPTLAMPMCSPCDEEVRTLVGRRGHRTGHTPPWQLAADAQGRSWHTFSVPTARDPRPITELHSPRRPRRWDAVDPKQS